MVTTILIIDMAEPHISHIEPQSRQILINNISNFLKSLNNQENIISLNFNKTDQTIPQLKEICKKHSNYLFIEKPKTNSFEKTKLLEILKQNKTSELIIIGIFASECVLKTTQSAIKNFKVKINPNLIEDPDDWEENKSLDWYKKNCEIF